MRTDNDTVEILYGKQPDDTVTGDPQTVDKPPTDEAAAGEPAIGEHGYELPTEKTTGNPYALDEDKGISDDLYGAESKVEISSETDLSIIASSEDEQALMSQNLSFMA